MAASCYVSGVDYARHWDRDYTVIATRGYLGPERRIATIDRRTLNHERRWDASRGRRFSAGDRRQGEQL